MLSRFEILVALNLRRVYKLILGYADSFDRTPQFYDNEGSEASDLIKKGIESDKPFLISKFGYAELRTILTFLQIQSTKNKWKKIMSFAKGKNVEPWWSNGTQRIITFNAGIFPKSIDIMEEFSKMIIQDLDQIDILGSLLQGEIHIHNYMARTKFIPFDDLHPFFHQNPWTTALANKKVLIIHPFINSIHKQFLKKDLLFDPPRNLPNFNLITFMPVQSIAGNIPSQYNNWFDSLNDMKSKINKIDFDIAILGCGAYGMPLAIHIKKELKKKAIHLGGLTQLLFGIKGSGWEKDPKFNSIFNEHWIKPIKEETPLGHHKIDNNFYW